MPVLVVAGQLDDKYRRIAERFRAASSAGETTAQIVPDCGHIVHRERPDEFVRIVRDYVDRIPNDDPR